jgi:predicted PurR-regulated permease PerM
VVLLPFGAAILWAVIIALLFHPVYERLLRGVGGRATPAAGLTLLLVLVIVILPLTLLTLLLAREAMGVYGRLQSGDLDPALYFRGVFGALPGWSRDLLRRFGLANFDSLQRELTADLAKASQFIAQRAFGLGMDTFDLVVNLFVTLYLSYFLLRDGAQLRGVVHQALPLPPAQRQTLIDRFTAVIRATVKGGLVVAAVQGTLGGLALWWLDIGGAVLWGAVMGFLSLLPAVGAALVWLPVAVYLLATGSTWSGVILIAYGVLVIGLVDNLLRPLLVGKDAGLPDYVVMTTTLGGIAVFGLNGVILGPVIAAMCVAVWHLVQDGPAEPGGANVLQPTDRSDPPT